MKAKIHPEWYPEAQVSCACGASFVVGAAKPTIRVDICSNCHPFFTGEMKFIDTMGRVERFQKKQEAAKKLDYKSKKKRKAEAAASQQKQPQSLKDMLMGMR